MKQRSNALDSLNLIFSGGSVTADEDSELSCTTDSSVNRKRQMIDFGHSVYFSVFNYGYL